MSFLAILQNLVRDNVGVLAAMFCDDEGEMISQHLTTSAELDTFEVKVLGASAATWVKTAQDVLGATDGGVQFSLRYQKMQLVVETLPDAHYVLALAQPWVSTRLLQRSLHRVAVKTLLEI